jgi:hypothetical protein
VSHILHLVKDATTQAALDVIREQAADPRVRVSVVLMHDAARATTTLPGEVYRLIENGSSGIASAPYPPISHAQLLDLIFTADTVITW